MRRRVLNFFNPGSISGRKAFGASVAMMLVIFLLDMETGTGIRLGALYVLPIALVGLHCDGRKPLVAAILLSVSFQTINVVSDAIALASSITDITVGFISALLVGTLANAVRHNHRELEALSQTDSLTKLQNRRGFELTVEAEIERQNRYGGTFSLVLIDLDKFKQLNDSRGHAEGDRALVVIGEILQGSIRDSDTSARLGGDEFSVLLPNTRRNECEVVCGQLVSRIQSRMRQLNFEITASIGASTFDHPPESLAAAFRIVDEAMYTAKAKGRNTAVSIQAMR
ncbi:MAG: GGDEF domain-containing protein [Rhodoferax sp.]|uniref:GGDEF domain-containing protein n=1 Tax=Rhodoferax sp. TaxID=50421 RepID=UPI00261509E6|nr:GGDEF domain-containing protein [Rhodoferax sp.]MDD5336278.1 GGDEF domain-containing protein [Rhodoferax sp.]